MPILKKFALEDQEQDFWCWAAVGVSVNTYYDGAPRTQCQLANQILAPQPPNCCSDASRDACDQPARLSEVLTALGHLAAHVTPRAVDASDVIDQIDAMRVVCVRVARAGDSVGHFIVIVGYDAPDADPTLIVQDPDRETVRVPYSELKTKYFGVYQWTHTYFTV